jgi:hypothetical protein
MPYSSMPYQAFQGWPPARWAACGLPTPLGLPMPYASAVGCRAQLFLRGEFHDQGDNVENQYYYLIVTKQGDHLIPRCEGIAT